MYLEGSDQHRGWFQSSLLTSVAMHGHAPYHTVLTHGFTVDAAGMKMSKSRGNVIAPQKVINTLGADILRLWVAATDYRNEMSISDEILKRMADAYRRMRNTARFLLGNLDGFDPASDLLGTDELVEIDRWAVARCGQLHERIVAAYDGFAFHQVYQNVHQFCVTDMGGFYLDVLKDRLYTTPAGSRARRSAQTAMYHILEALVRWLAPVLSFTAEEIWRYMPGERGESILLETWQAPPEVEDIRLLDRWRALIALRERVSQALEELRNAGRIGAPLDAEITLYAGGETYDLLASLGEELRFVFITSYAYVFPYDEREGTGRDLVDWNRQLADWPDDPVAVVVTPTDKPKCIRCWHHRDDVGSDPDHPEICGRCVENVEGDGEVRDFA